MLKISAAGTFEKRLKNNGTISSPHCVQSGAAGWFSLFKASSLFQPTHCLQTQPETALT